MELANIEQLLIKYENAETTLEEEALLKAYFLSDTVAPHLEEYQLIFAYFKASNDETYTNKINFKTKTRNYTWLPVAASVTLLVSMYLGSTKFEEYQERKAAAKTLAEVTKALKMVSSSLKKGHQAFNKLYVYEDSVHKIFKK